MRKSVLLIEAREYKPNGQEFLHTIKASNIFMLKIKLEKFLKNNIVNGWELWHKGGHSGNKGINAEAYLNIMIEEIN